MPMMDNFLQMFQQRTGVITMTLTAVVGALVSSVFLYLELSGTTKVTDGDQLFSTNLLLFSLTTLYTNSVILYAIYKRDQPMLKNAICFNWTFIIWSFLTGPIQAVFSPRLASFMVSPKEMLMVLFVFLAVFGYYSLLMRIQNTYYIKMRNQVRYEYNRRPHPRLSSRATTG